VIASEVGVITSDARAVDRDVESMDCGVRAMPSSRIGVCEPASRLRTADSELSAYTASAHLGLTCGECREPGWIRALWAEHDGAGRWKHDTDRR
jgi:hypothetical protein